MIPSIHSRDLLERHRGKVRHVDTPPGEEGDNWYQLTEKGWDNGIDDVLQTIHALERLVAFEESIYDDLACGYWSEHVKPWFDFRNQRIVDDRAQGINLATLARWYMISTGRIQKIIRKATKEAA